MAQVIWNSDIDVYNADVMPITVAKNIAKYLRISDLLVFSSVSKNTHLVVSEPRIWISMLKDISLWRPDDNPDSDDLHANPLNCLDSTCLNPSLAKKRILTIYHCLEKYYLDILSNKSFDKLKIFQDFQSPEEQCKILKNLMKYTQLDKDDNSRYIVQEKLGSLFEIFENALLRELDIHFDLEDYITMRRFVNVLVELDNQQTLIDFFIQKSVLDNRDNMFSIFEYFDPDEFFIESNKEKDKLELNAHKFDELIEHLVSIFNDEIKIIDLIFPQSVPMMYKISEELILNQLDDIFNGLIEASKPKLLHLVIVPYISSRIKNDLVLKLHKSKNLGSNSQVLVQELFDMQYEQIVTEYAREEIVTFKRDAVEKIQHWKDSIQKREEETTQNILRNVKSETKTDFLTSFRKAFTVGASSLTNDIEEQDRETYSEIQAKERILTENMKSINQIFSLKLATEILNDGRNCFVRMLHFDEFSIISIRKMIFSSVQEIFISVIELIGNNHLKPGFDKALTYLKTYKPPEEYHALEAIKPLVLFSDLVNVADLIMQMVEIFYKEEIVNRQIIKNENSILNPSLQKKKKLEEMIDNYVADGLNVGIDVLIDEIEKSYSSVLETNDYCPSKEQKVQVEGNTSGATRAVLVLDGNFDLLVGCAEKSVVDVFQQELAERFFQVIVKTIKSATISNTGAVTLISDLNLFYECIFKHIKTNKRLILPLFQSLQKVGSIYLISGDDSKSIGKLVSDLSKFNGIFGQEEIYEFVQRREDWAIVKKDVEKIMYGLSIGECCIM